MSRSPALAAVSAAAAIALTACSVFGGSSDPYGAGSSGASPRSVSGPPAEAQSLQPPRGTVLSANSTAQLGTVVIDGRGFTLYRFEEDSAQPPASTCTGPCATAWPPVLSTDPLTVEGFDKDQVDSVIRPDGKEQVTIGGWPVYRYAADDAPGATGGHGMGQMWFAVTPDGGKAEAP